MSAARRLWEGTLSIGRGWASFDIFGSSLPECGDAYDDLDALHHDAAMLASDWDAVAGDFRRAFAGTTRRKVKR